MISRPQKTKKKHCRLPRNYAARIRYPEIAFLIVYIERQYLSLREEEKKDIHTHLGNSSQLCIYLKTFKGEYLKKCLKKY
jgi:hypothetical protein